MNVTVNFLYEQGFGQRTRLDTLFIFCIMYEHFKYKGVNEETLRMCQFLREEIDKNRKFINNQTYSIIQISSILNKIKELNIENLRVDENIYNILSEIKPKAFVYEIPELNKDINLLLDMEEKIEEDKMIDKEIGIYGIYIDNELKYIGKTYVSFKTRYLQHKRNINDGQLIHNLMLKAKKENKNIEFKPLLIIGDMNFKGTKKKITKKDLQCIELALITMYKPIGNVQGRLQPYIFNNN